MQVESTKPTGYQQAIAEATGAPEQVLAILEEIMRTEVFHSTLDWQSPEEFRAGAREAFVRYKADQGFYDAQALWKRGSYRLFRAEQALEAVRQKGQAGKTLAAAQADLEAARFAEAAARASLSKVS